MRQGRILWVPLGYREAMTHASSTDLDRVLASLDPTPSGTYAFSLVNEIPQNVDIFALIRDEDSYTVVVEEDAAREAGINPDELYTRIDRVLRPSWPRSESRHLSLRSLLRVQLLRISLPAAATITSLFSLIALRRQRLFLKIWEGAQRAGFPPEIFLFIRRGKAFGIK